MMKPKSLDNNTIKSAKPQSIFINSGLCGAFRAVSTLLADSVAQRHASGMIPGRGRSVALSPQCIDPTWCEVNA